MVVEDEMNGKMMNRVFMYISAMEMKEYWGEFHEKCKQIIGIRKLLHCDISRENPVFNNCKDEVTPEWHDFEKVELTSYDNTTNSDKVSDEEDFIEGFATSVIKKRDITIIRAGYDHLYYLGILISKIYKSSRSSRERRLPTWNFSISTCNEV